LYWVLLRLKVLLLMLLLMLKPLSLMDLLALVLFLGSVLLEFLS
jgi:hypothetical protein